MPARTLDGRALAKARNQATAERVAAERDRIGRAPRLDVILVGDDPASDVYVRNKERAAAKAGIEAHTHRVPADVDQAGLAARIRDVSADDAVDGVILQLPLPPGLDAEPLLALIDPVKDVDGFHPENLGHVLRGSGKGHVPATPLGITWLLDAAGVALEGAEVCIVSHSNLIGKPLAALLVNANATVTVCHKYTRDLAAHTRAADVLVTAAGVPNLIMAEHVRDGATVIDAATVLTQDGSLVGDCDAAAVAAKAAALTPVPGGVGPVTVSALLANVTDAWLARHA